MSTNGHHPHEGSAFGVEAAATVTGFSERQLARWDRDGWYSPSFGAPERRGVYGRVYSYADLVRLRTARGLVDRGVPIRRALVTVANLRTLDWREVPRATLYVAGWEVSALREAVGSAEGEVAAIEAAEVVAEVDDVVRRLGDRAPKQIGATERRRGWVNGWEVFAGTRIPMLTIVGLLEDGWPRAEILGNYDGLRDADIDLAEARLRERVAFAS